MNNLTFLTNKIITAIETFDVKSANSREEYNRLVGCLFRLVIAERKINRSTLLLSKSFAFTRVPASIEYFHWLFDNLYTLPLHDLILIFESLTLQKSLYEIVFDREIYNNKDFSMQNENLWFKWQFKGAQLSELYRGLL